MSPNKFKDLIHIRLIVALSLSFLTIISSVFIGSQKVLGAPSTVLKHLPTTTFSYGNNCGTYKNGCPLTALTVSTKTTQVKTPNDFFLKSVDNGYNGKVVFEYWANSSGNNALNVKYCDPKKSNTAASSGCKTDNQFNSQRHRVSAKVVYDGLGNYYRTGISYSTDEGLASVDKYQKVFKYMDNCSVSCPSDAGCGGPDEGNDCTFVSKGGFPL
jgi:hypothetical protein